MPAPPAEPDRDGADWIAPILSDAEKARLRVLQAYVTRLQTHGLHHDDTSEVKAYRFVQWLRAHGKMDG